MHPDRVRRRRSIFLVACVAVVAPVLGCTPERGESDADEATPESTLAVPVVTPPPERQTPFCQIMLDLDASLPADPTVDVTAEVLDAYREALPVAPPEIAPELEAVIIGLETGTDPTLAPTTVGDSAVADVPTVTSATATVPDDEQVTADTFVPPTGTAGPGSTLEPPTDEEAFVEEGYVPDDDPVVRLGGYIDFACRDNVNNPGPPPTQPSATPVPTDDVQN